MRALLVSLYGSLALLGRGEEAAVSPAPTPTCVEVRDIGNLPLRVQVGDVTVTFDEWAVKDADAQEFIGFRATATGTVSFVVRAAGERFDGAGSDRLGWMNPHGVVGSSVRGIDGVELCR